MRAQHKRSRDKIDELIHRPPAIVLDGLYQLRYLILTEGLTANQAGESHPRNYVWTILLQVDLRSTQTYLDLVSRGASFADEKIQNDTFRTLATDRAFRSSVKEEALSRVLNAYVNDTNRSYVQGMNVIAAPFLYVCRSESQAFALFHRFVTKCCPAYVTPTLIGVHSGLDLVDIILRLADPQLFKHLRSKMLTANLYAFASVMTFSAGTPPLAEVLHLWDLLIAYGSHLNILFVVAQVVMMRDKLLQSAKPMALLRSFPALNAKDISTTALAIMHKIPRNVYDLLVRHCVEEDIRGELDALRE